MKRIIKVIKAEEGDIIKTSTFKEGALKPYELGKYRVGDVRVNWLAQTLQDYWLRTITTFRPDLCEK